MNRKTKTRPFELEIHGTPLEFAHAGGFRLALGCQPLQAKSADVLLRWGQSRFSVYAKDGCIGECERRKGGKWMFVTMAHRAPKGGINIAGKHYGGGAFIPNEVLAKATPEEKSKLAGVGSDKPSAAPSSPKATAKSDAPTTPPAAEAKSAGPAKPDATASKKYFGQQWHIDGLAKTVKAANTPESHEDAALMLRNTAQHFPPHIANRIHNAANHIAQGNNGHAAAWLKQASIDLRDHVAKAGESSQPEEKKINPQKASAMRQVAENLNQYMVHGGGGHWHEIKQRLNRLSDLSYQHGDPTTSKIVARALKSTDRDKIQKYIMKIAKHVSQFTQ